MERTALAYKTLGARLNFSCTPYLFDNIPRQGEVIAFSESSATPYVNSVWGALTNRESAQSALCAAIVGKVPEYGLLLKENRRATARVVVKADLRDDFAYQQLGWAVPQKIGHRIPVFEGIPKNVGMEGLMNLGAQLNTAGAVPMYHIAGVTPEAPDLETALQGRPPEIEIDIRQPDLDEQIGKFSDEPGDIDFVMFGCPHHTLRQVREVAGMLEGRRLRTELWILDIELHVGDGPAHGIAGDHRGGRRAYCGRHLPGPAVLAAFERQKGRHGFAQVRLLSQTPRHRFCGPRSENLCTGRLERIYSIMSSKTFPCHKIAEGCASGEALVSGDDICFYMIDPKTGIVIEKGHALEGKSVAGKVLVFPGGKGSSVVQADGLYQLQLHKNEPRAMIIAHADTVLVASAIVIGIPLVSKLPAAFYRSLAPDCRLEVDADGKTVTLTDASAARPDSV